jgi:hypothetical protein
MLSFREEGYHKKLPINLLVSPLLIGESGGAGGGTLEGKVRCAAPSALCASYPILYVLRVAVFRVWAKR